MTATPTTDTPPPTVITLTLPNAHDGGVVRGTTATLLMQRGDLGHLLEFHYSGSLMDINAAIHAATAALNALQDHPPVLPAAVPVSPAVKPSAPPAKAPKAAEITLTVGKKTRTVPAAHLHAPADQIEVAKQVAGRLIAGGLWDGLSAIALPDPARTRKVMQHLADKELALFTLADFAEPVTDTDAEDAGEEDTHIDADTDADREMGDDPDETRMRWQVGDTVPLLSDAQDVDGDPVPFDVGRIVEIDDQPDGVRLWLESLDGQADVWVDPTQLAA